MLHLHDAIIKTLPAVEELHLDMSFELMSPRFFEQSAFPRLRDLQLCTTGDKSPVWHLDLASSLEKVGIFRRKHFWPSISSKSARQLHLTIDIERVMYAKGGLPSFIPQEWPLLHSLTIPPLYLPKWADELYYLRTLSLTGWSRSQDWFGDAVSRFCCHLARNPTSLPSLGSLTLHDVPQWDIYFLMLNRRNAVSYGGISPLKVLGLQERFPRLLYRPIMDLLHGKEPLPDSSLPHTLSIHYALPLLLDPSLYGCISCILCFQPCEEKPGWPSNHVNPFQSGELFPYPTTDDEILSQWEDLNESYQNWLPASMQRRGECKKSRIIYHSNHYAQPQHHMPE